MTLTTTKVVAAGAALAVAFLGGVALAPSVAQIASAQVGGPPSAVAERGPLGTDLFQAAATYIGITADQLRTEMGTDKSMADVAVAHGKTRDGLIAALVAAEQQNIQQRISQIVDQKGFPQRPGGPGFPGHMGLALRGEPLQAAATYLGISVSDLQTQLRSGKTLAQIAAATAGKTRDGLIAALVADETARIDKLVTDGKLTADQAAKLKTGMAERVTAMVDRTGPAFGPGFGPRGGRP